VAELYLVRHGQASYGAEDYDKLSDLGWRQSRWLGEHFAAHGVAFDRVVRGRLRRHAETLEGIAQGMATELAHEEHAGLDEYDARVILRAHTGADSPQGEDRRAHFLLLREALYAWTDGTLPVGAEHGFRGFRARVLEALGMLRSGRAGRVLVVSSGGPISAILAEVLGMPARGVVDLNLQTRNTGVTELRVSARAAHLVCFNAVPHLERPERRQALTHA
jgi:broad specificity phosphatase PhoE